MDNKDIKEINMTYSGILHNDKGEKFVRVRFERRSDSAYAEAIVPSGKVTSSDVFSQEELNKISSYILENKTDIMAKARAISSFVHIFS
ncbi:hypothetical protein QYZ88_002045 [Lachnospiraceae bacterium C1.1]|nr:hypothetical protein [Lachnospiraceae bacterium C1.1]